MTESSIRVGLVGFGVAAKYFHAPFVTTSPAFFLKSVVERHAREAKASYPWVNVVKNIDILLKDPDIELIIVATPNIAHFELASAAIRAGKHVVIDKPFTNTSEQALKLLGLAKEKRTVLSVFHNRRWDGDFLTVSSIVENNLLGELVDFESYYDRYRNACKPNAWREQNLPGSGIFYDLGSHLIDQALLLFGLPLSVSADIRIQRAGGKADDNFRVVFDYESCKVTMGASMLAAQPRPRFRLSGTEGSYIKYGMDPQEEALRNGLLPGTEEWSTEQKEQWGSIRFRLHNLNCTGHLETTAGCYQKYYENLYDTIRNGAPLLVTPEQAVKVIQLIELANVSSQQKRTLSLSDYKLS
jgi:predicted dehydrogenase